MSLWTPYATPEADEPMDLRKIKDELPDSPESEEASGPSEPAPQPETYPYGEQHYLLPSVSPAPHHIYHQPPVYQPDQPFLPLQPQQPYQPYQLFQYQPFQQYPVPAVSSVQISPISVGSSSSDVENLPELSAFHPAISPTGSVPHSLLYDGDLADDPEFRTFERRAMQTVAEKNGGTLLGHNPRMRRVVQTTQAVDDSYRKQRERNNQAAKASRDRRKLREMEMALKISYLTGQNKELKQFLRNGRCKGCNTPYIN